MALLTSQGKDSVREVKRAVQRDVTEPFPELSHKKARDITPDDIVTILSVVYKRGAKTALILSIMTGQITWMRSKINIQI